MSAIQEILLLPVSLGIMHIMSRWAAKETSMAIGKRGKKRFPWALQISIRGAELVSSTFWAPRYWDSTLMRIMEMCMMNTVALHRQVWDMCTAPASKNPQDWNSCSHVFSMSCCQSHVYSRIHDTVTDFVRLERGELYYLDRKRWITREWISLNEHLKEHAFKKGVCRILPNLSWTCSWKIMSRSVVCKIERVLKVLCYKF